MFLNELEEFLELATEKDFESVMVPVFKRLAAGYTNCHFQVGKLFMLRLPALIYGVKNASVWLWNRALPWASHRRHLLLIVHQSGLVIERLRTLQNISRQYFSKLCHLHETCN